MPGMKNILKYFVCKFCLASEVFHDHKSLDWKKFVDEKYFVTETVTDTSTFTTS